MLTNLQKQPPQNPRGFRIEIKKRFGMLASAACRLHVSVGVDRFEGEKMVALAEFCRRRYHTTTIIVSDTLQRYNFPDLEDAMTATRMAGEEWLARNEKALLGFKIKRWDDFISDPTFASAVDKMRTLTESGPANAALNAISMDFSARRGVPVSNCNDFLLEELTVFSRLFEDPAVDVYPGAWITPLIASTRHKSFEAQNLRCLSVEPVRLKVA